MTSQKLPDRELFMLYECPRFYRSHHLKRIADTHNIFKKRKKFYRHYDRAANRYHHDRMLEYDFYSLGHAASVNRTNLTSARRFLTCLQHLNEKGPAYSWYVEISHKNGCFVDTINLQHFVVELVESLQTVVDHLPAAPNQRPTKIALRKWANVHMDYWEYEMHQKITISNDRKDGMSRCHQFLHDLLMLIDPEAVDHLPTIIRERRSAATNRTERASC